MEHFKIPKNLQKPEFRFVKLGDWDKWKHQKTKKTQNFDKYEYLKIDKKEWNPLGKTPFESGWQKKNYAFNTPTILKHLSFEKNIGVIGGAGRLRIQDIDDEALANELIEKLNTFTIRTGSGGAHFYFTSDLDTNFVLKDDKGEFRGKDYQVVAPNCRHPNGNFYEVIRDIPIREIGKEELLEILKPYLRDKEIQTYFGEVKTTLNCSTGKLETSGSDESRSAFEYRRVLSMLRQNKTKDQIFNEMDKYSKWSIAPEQYKELTYKKASQFVESQQIAEEESEKLRVMDYRSLMDYDVEPVKWLIKDQIPKGEVGVLVGKRGEKKTWTALKQALCLCSGRPIFNDEVPEKKRVMIIDEESGEGILAKRLQLLANADGILKEELELISISFTGLKLDKFMDKKTQEFYEIVDNFKPDLIIVDCLQRVCSFDIDKENALISSLFTGTVRPMIKTYGMSWLFIHHLRKSPNGNGSNSGDPLDEVRGGSELVNYCRFVLSCSSPKHQNRTEDGSEMLVFRVLKMSNSNVPEAKVINFIPDNADPELNTKIQMDYIGKCEEVLKTEIRVANAIKEYLFNEGIRGEFTTKNITESADKIGFKYTFIAKGLKELWESGFIEKVKRGVWEVVGESNKKTSNIPTLKDFNKTEDSKQEINFSELEL